MNSSHSHCTILSTVLCFLLPVRWRFMGRDQYSPTSLHDCQMKVDSSIFSSWTRSEWHIRGFLQNRDKTNTHFYCFANLGFKSSKKKKIVDCFRIKFTLLGLECRLFHVLPPVSSLISCHSPGTSVIRTSSQLSHTLCLCPCCSFCLGVLLLSSCSTCCLYLKTHLISDFSDLSSFSLCSLNDIVNRRRPRV